jgi:gliding motility-associated lipoprotein GldH
MRNTICIFLLFVFFSCDKTVYESHNSFEEKSWDTDSVITFNYNISDTLNSYEMSILVRHTVDYEYQNLFLFLSGDLNDTIELELADKIGKWKGSGLSDIREFEYLFANNKVFSKKGNHSINIEQAMRFGAEEKIQNLEHVSDIGLIIRKQND